MTELKVPDEILDRVNNLIKLARQHVSRNPDGAVPIFHLFKTGNRVELYATPFTGDTHAQAAETKDHVAKTMRLLCVDPEVEMLAFLSESWTLAVDGQEELNQFYAERAAGKWESLSEHPKAKECMLLVVETPTFMMMGQAFIARANDGRTLGPIRWLPAKKDQDNRFSDFFSMRRRLAEKVRGRG